MNVEPFDRLVDHREAAVLLGVTPTTIRIWTCRGELPCVKLLGRRTVRYRLSTLQRLIETGKPDSGGEAA